MLPSGLGPVCSPQAHQENVWPTASSSLVLEASSPSPTAMIRGARSLLPRAVAALLERSALSPARLFSILNDVFYIGVEAAHSTSKIYSAKKWQKIGKA